MAGVYKNVAGWTTFHFNPLKLECVHFSSVFAKFRCILAIKNLYNAVSWQPSNSM